jgi:hypothetical protein
MQSSCTTPDLRGHLSSSCHAFVQSCLIVDPKLRPSVNALMSHPWLRPLVVTAECQKLPGPSRCQFTDAAAVGVLSGTHQKLPVPSACHALSVAAGAKVLALEEKLPVASTRRARDMVVGATVPVALVIEQELVVDSACNAMDAVTSAAALTIEQKLPANSVDRTQPAVVAVDTQNMGGALAPLAPSRSCTNEGAVPPPDLHLEEPLLKALHLDHNQMNKLEDVPDGAGCAAATSRPGLKPTNLNACCFLAATASTLVTASSNSSSSSLARKAHCKGNNCAGSASGCATDGGLPAILRATGRAPRSGISAAAWALCGGIVPVGAPAWPPHLDMHAIGSLSGRPSDPPLPISPCNPRPPLPAGTSFSPLKAQPYSARKSLHYSLAACPNSAKLPDSPLQVASAVASLVKTPCTPHSTARPRPPPAAFPLKATPPSPRGLRPQLSSSCQTNGAAAHLSIASPRTSQHSLSPWSRMTSPHVPKPYRSHAASPASPLRAPPHRPHAHGPSVPPCPSSGSSAPQAGTLLGPSPHPHGTSSPSHRHVSGSSSKLPQPPPLPAALTTSARGSLTHVCEGASKPPCADPWLDSQVAVPNIRYLAAAQVCTEHSGSSPSPRLQHLHGGSSAQMDRSELSPCAVASRLPALSRCSSGRGTPPQPTFCTPDDPSQRCVSGSPVDAYRAASALPRSCRPLCASSLHHPNRLPLFRSASAPLDPKMLHPHPLWNIPRHA